MNRVVVTGIGAVTPLGNSFSTSWEGLADGRVATHGGRLMGFDVQQYLSIREINRLDTFVHYAVAAAAMALCDAAIKSPSGFASIIGTSRGGITMINSATKRLASSQGNARKASPYLMPATTASMAASYISQKFGLRGHTLGISNACTSGANAVGEAYRLIKHGYSAGALAGGTDAPFCELCLEGYRASGALSRGASAGASRPFCVGRDGFVLAEGACVVVLEDYAFALSRGARIYAEVLGYGNTSDGFDMVRPDSAMQGTAILKALTEAAIGPDGVDFVNAHATSTPIGDAAESEAIHIALRDNAGTVPVTANKSITGHMLSASAAFEAAATAMSIYTGLIPPTINIQELDPACRLNVITKPLKLDGLLTGITNSFGFGGVNASLVLGAVDIKRGSSKLGKKSLQMGPL
ncbi:MAG: beta-ketoacyl-[acyl-carrier-protein] synthase family protein [Nitrospirae bacterium]|nr:beta-ketoacyl-[acyl-carrier-protein] synthase family protein [Nitrospirota bacterium]